jgi:hypothetical protein
LPVKPPLPEVFGRRCEIVDIEASGARISRGPLVVTSSLIARYNREELYEKVWTRPLWRIAAEYGMSRTRMVEACKGLHIPLPGEGYWSKMAANKVVPDRPSLPEVSKVIGLDGPAEISETGINQEPLTVSAGLMSRYNREELYKKAWEVPMIKLAKEYGVSNEALGKTCRKLHVPVPGRGYWMMKAANHTVEPKPPLPKVRLG